MFPACDKVALHDGKCYKSAYVVTKVPMVTKKREEGRGRGPLPFEDVLHVLHVTCSPVRPVFHGFYPHSSTTGEECGLSTWPLEISFFVLF